MGAGLGLQLFRISYVRTKYSLLNACGYALAVLSLGSLVSIMAFSGLARSQRAPEAGRYLADLHKAAGMECDGCHKEKPPKGGSDHGNMRRLPQGDHKISRDQGGPAQSA